MGSAENVMLRYTTIANGNTGILLERGSTNRSRVALSLSNVCRCKKGLIIYGTPGSEYFKITKARITQNKYNGIQIMDHANVWIEDSVLFNNRLSGLDWDSRYSIVLNIRNVIIEANHENGLYLNFFGLSQKKVVNIKNSKFYNNLGNGIYLAGTFADDHNTWIFRNNVLAKNGKSGLAVKLSPAQSYFPCKSNFYMSNNTFSSQNTSDYSLSLRIGDSHQPCDKNILIENNTFFEIRNSLLIYMEGVNGKYRVKVKRNIFEDINGTRPIVFDMDQGKFTENRVVNCTASSGGIVHLKRGYAMVVSGNSFVNPGVDFDVIVYAVFDKNKLPINMSRNYWGTSDMGSARSRVSDFFIDPLKSVSNISPFYSSDPVLNHSAILVMRNSIAYFLDKDGFVGGKLQQSLAIPMDTSLKVKRTIWVPHGKRLRIESGAHLQFWKSTGIFAEGDVDILGSMDANVFMDSLRTSTFPQVPFTGQASGINLSHLLFDGGRDTSTSDEHARVREYPRIDPVAPISWSGIRVHDANISFRYCEINGASTGLYFMNTAEQREITHANVRLSTFSNCGIGINARLYRTTEIIIHRSSIISAKDHGIHVMVLNRNIVADIMLSDSTIKKSGRRAISLESPGAVNSSLRFSLENMFVVNNRDGINLDTYQNSFVNVSIIKSVISGNQGFALSGNFLPRNLLIDKSNFSSNRKGIHIRLYGSVNQKNDVLLLSGKPVNVVENNFSDISLGAYLHINADRSFRSEIYVIDNEFSNSLAGVRNNDHNTGALVIVAVSLLTLRIKNNNFTNMKFAAVRLDVDKELRRGVIECNKILNCNTALHFKVKSYEDLTIRNNEIIQNVGDPVTYFEAVDSNLLSQKPVQILNNRFVNNTVTTILLNYSCVVLHRNLFSNPDASYNIRLAQGIKNIRTQSSNSYDNCSINATMNYWGGTSERVIAKQLYDNNSEATLPTILYKPYLLLGDMETEKYGTEIDTQFIKHDHMIGGMVNGKIVLTPDASPYTVTSDIIIGSHDTLVLEPGVELRFQENTALLVYGTLLANGESSLPVIMLSSSGARWKGITVSQEKKVSYSVLDNLVINNTSNGLTIDGVLPVLKAVNSSYSAENCITIFLLSDTTDDDSTSLSHNSIRAIQNVSTKNCGKSGIMIMTKHGKHRMNDRSIGSSTFTLIIKNCAVSSSKEHGINITGTGANIWIQGCQIVDNRGIGITVTESWHKSLEVTNSVFGSNSLGAIMVDYALFLRKTFHFNINLCSFTNNTLNYSGDDDKTPLGNEKQRLFHAHLITIHDRHLQHSGTWSITNNVFNKNMNFSHMLFFENKPQYMGDFSFKLSNNTFTENFLHDNLFSPSNDHKYLTKIDLERNHFVNNTCQNHSLLSFPISDQMKCSIKVFKNKFISNCAKRIIYLSTCASKHETIFQNGIIVARNSFIDNNSTDIVLLKNTYGSVFDNNIFENKIALCELHSSNKNSYMASSGVYARYCFWGSVDFEQVFPRICGFETNMSLSHVVYLPFHISRNLSDRNNVNLTGNDAFLHDSGFGGVISGMIKLNASEKPYVIRRSIFIRVCACLMIEAGARLLFAPDTGILVEGTLWVGHHYKSEWEITPVRVTLSSMTTNSSRWFGIVFAQKQCNSDASRDLSLHGDFGAHMGLVYTVHNGSYGTVCDDRFDARESLLVCRMLGYSGNSAIFSRIPVDEDVDIDTDPIVLDDLECMGSERSLSECQTLDSAAGHNCDHTEDVGVICYGDYQPTSTNHTASWLHSTDVVSSNYGIMFLSFDVMMSDCHVRNTTYDGITARSNLLRQLNFEGSVIDKSGRSGIHLDVNDVKLVVENVFISNSRDLDINAAISGGYLRLDGVHTSTRMRSHYGNGIKITCTRYHGNYNISVVNSIFSFGMQNSAVSIICNVHTSSSFNLEIIGNDFIRNIISGLVIHVEGIFDHRRYREWNVRTRSRTIYCEQNVFLNSGANMINSDITFNVTVLHNLFIMQCEPELFHRSEEDSLITNWCSFITDYRQSLTATNLRNKQTRCYFTVHIVSAVITNFHQTSIVIEKNVFSNITDESCVVRLSSDGHAIIRSTFQFNRIDNSSVTKAAMNVDSRIYDINHNIFSNPDSPFEVNVIPKGPNCLKLYDNYWGCGDTNENIMRSKSLTNELINSAESRIFDKKLNDQLMCTDIGPMLLNDEYNCTRADNCSANGWCVKDDVCVCSHGWSGSTCDRFRCKTVKNCLKSSNIPLNRTADIVSVNVLRREYLGENNSMPYIYIVLNVRLNYSGSFYVKLFNYLSPDMRQTDTILLKITAQDRNETIDYVITQDNKDDDGFIVHFIDYIGTEEFQASGEDVQYRLVFGKPNRHVPLFVNLRNERSVFGNMDVRQKIFSVTAIDDDLNKINYSLLSHSDVFEINNTSGIVTFKHPVLNINDTIYTLLIKAVDDGFPSRSTTAEIKITIIGRLNTTRTTADQNTNVLTDENSNDISSIEQSAVSKSFVNSKYFLPLVVPAGILAVIALTIMLALIAFYFRNVRQRKVKSKFDKYKLEAVETTEI